MPTQVLICVGFFVIESFFEKIEKNFDKTIDKCEYLWYTVKVIKNCSGGIAQLARAIGSYPIGRGFKSNFRYQHKADEQFCQPYDLARWSSG